MGLKNLWGEVVKWLDNGRNQLFGRVWGILTILLQVAIYLKVDGADFGNEELLYGFVILTLVLLIGGFFYTKSGLYSAEVSSRAKESPEIMETLKNTRKILKRLDK